MLVLLITNNNSHFFDDANVQPTDVVMIRRSIDDLTNVTDENGNKPDRVIIEGSIWINNDSCIDLARGLDETAMIIIRHKDKCIWCTRHSFIKGSEATFKITKKILEEC